MQAHVLLFGAAVAVIAATIDPGTSRTPQAGSVEVSVRVDCLAGRGVAFSLTPWAARMNPGDSLSWVLDPQSNAESMEIQLVKGNNAWPFARKPPYRTTKGRPVGARGLDNNQRGSRYKYAVQAICVRSTAPYDTDTVLVDPDIIIIRGDAGN